MESKISAPKDTATAGQSRTRICQLYWTGAERTGGVREEKSSWLLMQYAMTVAAIEQTIGDRSNK
jgi:hypothetical protein